MPYSVTDLDELFLNAAETERRLPSAIRNQKMVSSWPEYVNDWKSYGWEKYTPRLSPATSEQVTQFEKALFIGVTYMSSSDRELVWTVAHSAAFRSRGAHWSKIAKTLHSERRAVKRKYQQALMRLYYNLKRQKGTVKV